ncbi:MAG: hypothetical protein M3256_21835 [Actinomycetota bacterium]|nr:hypothetical protein [Actinomycetota bacterium]
MSTSEGPGDSQEIRPLDPVASVREHPDWFFGTGRFEWRTAVGLLLTEVLQSPLTREAQVLHVDDWVAVSSDADWLEGDLEAFTKPTVYRAGGTNATRVEVVLTAFCDAVVTATREQRNEIRTVGEKSMPLSVVEMLAEPPAGRVIVFRVPSTNEPDIESVVPRTTDRMARALATIEDRARQFQHA